VRLPLAPIFINRIQHFWVFTNLVRYRIGISQNQSHINADVAPQKYNGTEGLLQEKHWPYGRLAGLELSRVSP
jgi:hypothetical protein